MGLEDIIGVTDHLMKENGKWINFMGMEYINGLMADLIMYLDK